MSTSLSESRASRPVRTSAARPSPLAANTCRTRRTMFGSSSTSRMRGRAASAMRCCLSGSKANPAELLPTGLPSPRVPQASQSPVQGELAVSQILQHGIQQEDQDLTAAAEGQEVALEPVSQAVAEAPGAHQDRQDVDQYAVAKRCEQKRQQVLGAEQLQAGYPLHHKEEQDAGIAHDLDHWSVVLEQPERRERNPADPTKLGLPQHGPVVPQ